MQWVRVYHLEKLLVEFGEPTTTLHSKVRLYSSLFSKKGPRTVLTEEQENKIVLWILHS